MRVPSLQGTSTVPPLQRSALRREFSTLACRSLNAAHAGAERLAALCLFRSGLQGGWLLGDGGLEVCTFLALCSGTALSVQAALAAVLVWVIAVEWLVLGEHGLCEKAAGVAITGK